MNYKNEIIDWLPGKSDRINGSDWLPVKIHLMDTEGIMELLVCKWLPDNVRETMSKEIGEETLIKYCKFAALVHDIGKYTPVFLSRILGNISGLIEKLNYLGLDTNYCENDSYNHADCSAAILKQYKCPEAMAAIVASHHGMAPDIYNFQKDFCGTFKIACQGSKDQSKIWKMIHQTWIDYSLKESGFETIDQIPHVGKPAQLLITALLIIADWIASNPSFFPLFPFERNDTDKQQIERVRTAWEKVCLTLPWDAKCNYCDSDTFKEVFGFCPNPVQLELMNVVNQQQSGGIFILEAPMGCGKTEAALIAAERLNTQTGCGGIFFGLPTQATANGIFERLLTWAKQKSEEDDTIDSIRLAHGMAELNDLYHDLFMNSNRIALIDDEDKKENALIVHDWFSGRKQALLANFVVGTIDQFLMASLKRKHFMLRHLGLAGKVVILDECHAYDAYMNRYLDRTLNWLGQYNTPVIILSATLPSDRRTELIKSYLNKKEPESDTLKWEKSEAYPLLTWTSEGKIFQKTISLTEPSYKVFIDSVNEEGITPYIKASLHKVAV